MAEKDLKSKKTDGDKAEKKPATKKVTAQEPAKAEKPVKAQKAAPAKPAEQKPKTAAKPVAQKPAAAEKPKTETKKAAAEPVKVEKPKAATKPVVEKPAAKKVAAEPVKAQKTVKQEPAASKPVAQKPAAKKVATDNPTAEKHKATAKPVAQKPAGERVAATKPAKSDKPAKTEEFARAEKPIKTEKPAKAGKPEKSVNLGGSVAAIWQNKRARVIIMSAISFILVVAIILGVVFGARSCANNDNIADNDENNGNETNVEYGGSLIDSIINGGWGLRNDEPEILDARTVSGDKPEGAVNSDGNPLLGKADDVEGDKFEYNYTSTSEVGFSSEILSTRYERQLSVAYEADGVTERHDEGLESGYPKYGYTLQGVIGDGADKVAARDALIAESDYMCAHGTRNNSGNGENGDGTYTWMDAEGYLYRGTTAEPVQATNPDGTVRKLYKHTAAAGMYFGDYNGATDLSDDEPGLVKEVTIRPRNYGSYSVTGVYAPAGEVIKIEISEKDMRATGGITIHIGQALYNGQSNNIWTAKGQMQRFPNILNTMNVNVNTATLENGVYTAYVGSFVGGPLYIRNTSAKFTATISGGVAYSHFILGYTTKEEYEKNKTSTAPYFDLEVWNFGVLHSGPKLYAQNFTYEDIYKAAVLWEKVSSVTTTGSNQGIVFLYDPFVAAGAAVAFPGRSSVNCPAGWMSSSLNYNSIVSSGAWGNFHEYHHNFQGYGVGNGGEVTNNGMTLVSYALFTKISSRRGISNYGGEGLGGWNSYTSATWALNEVLKIPKGETPSNGNQGLTLYSTLLHNFGANNYIQAKYRQQSAGYGQSYAGYLRAWQDVTHNDMTYYFKDILQGLDEATAANYKNSDYPTFVPVSSVYQTGRSYMYDGEKKYFKTMQPYVIPYGKAFNIDLSKYYAPNGQYQSGSIVIPDGFSYRIKSITKPEHGSIEMVDDYNFKFTPDNNLMSGQIIVTLEIVKNNRAFRVDDVDLVLEFEQSHETNKMTLERTAYFFSESDMYSDAVEAYNANFAGFTEKKDYDHANPTQNCNTDIWLVSAGFEDRFPNATSEQMMANNNNSVHVVNGKLYFQDDGKYRVYLRGRKNCAAYFSLDGATYELGAHITEGSGDKFYPGNADSYFDAEFDNGNVTITAYCSGETKQYTYKLSPDGNNDITNWLYVREVLIVKSSDSSYIGLGTAKWAETMFTMVEKYYDGNGNEVESMDSEGYDHTETKYYDYQGNEVPAETANGGAQFIPPAANAQPSYVNAYRSDYEFPTGAGFESDYFYTRNYSYSYTESYEDLHGQFVGDHNCFYDANRTDYRPEYLLDGNKSTVALSKSQALDTTETIATPWTFTVDLGELIGASRMTVTGYQHNGQNQTPTWIELYVSYTDDADDFTLVYKNERATLSGSTLIADFELQYFRYYKICVKNPANNARTPAIADIDFSFAIPNGTRFTPDNDSFTYVGDWQIQKMSSTFGHVYEGATDAEMTFKFTGDRFALFGEGFYEVYVDGEIMQSVSLKEKDWYLDIDYMTELLDYGEHTVVIKCTNVTDIDSIVVFK